ncbi:hypothetical protein BK412_25895 [Vibrio campbellii]|uniref:DUF6680 family protein n=1 Tax=Vibrio campbellii TaxID=680 RepID=UPI0009BD5DCE|nr:DUF6680 family protein [Vibrio campbellii]OQP99829.1 hypothetical protein BK412_25895 [Vibrio campbellii]
MLESIGMDTKDVIMTAAVIVGPILAVQAQKLVESFSEKRERRMRIFRTLMSTRAERVHREHVQSLNMIDIEFYGRVLPIIGTKYQTKKEQAVTHAWKMYNSHLSRQSEYDTLEPWLKKNDELFVELIYAMSQCLSYDYDKVQLERDCYRPKAHGDYEQSQLNLLTGLEKVVSGERPIPMYVVNLTSVQNNSVPSEDEVEPVEAKT